MAYAIGIDIGGTNIKMVAVRPDGTEITRQTTPTDDATEARSVWVERIQGQIKAMTEHQSEPPLCVGLAAPGFAAPNGRTIAWMHGRMEAVQGLDWTVALGMGNVVPVLNDAHAALIGEAWLGAAAGSKDVMLLTLGTGVGGGAMIDGRLLKGHIGRGGHLGHISLNPELKPDITGTPGSLEDAIGECTLWERSGGRFGTTAELLQAVRGGDWEAAEVWIRSVRALAAGMVGLINVLDPEVVILGGGIAQAGDDLLHPLQAYLDRWEWRPTGGQVQIVLAALGAYAGAFGAASNALQYRQA